MKRRLSDVLKFVRDQVIRFVRHNGGFKVLALLLSLLLWAGLITQDPTLTRDRTFTNVSVNVTGADTLQRNGFIVVSDLDEALGDVTLRVAVPQMQYQTVQASNYNARLDLSRITEAGTQSLRILTVNSGYGTVQEVTPPSVEIEVEEYVTRYRIPVQVHPVGTAPAGYYVGNSTASPSMVAVSGPRSLVDQVVCAEAVVELNNLPAREGLSRRATGFTLLDENGNQIVSDLLEVTSESVLLDSVVIEQRLYTLRNIALSDIGLVRGTPADGYEVKSVSITPEIVTVAGAESDLTELDALYPDGYVDVTGLTESVNSRQRLRETGSLAYVSASIVTVAVEIGPIIQDATFNSLPINVVNVEDGLTAEAGVSAGSVVVSGPKLWIRQLRARDVSLRCDASGLTEGTYELPVLCVIEDSEGVEHSVEVSPATVEVTVSAR